MRRTRHWRRRQLYSPLKLLMLPGPLSGEAPWIFIVLST